MLVLQSTYNEMMCASKIQHMDHLREKMDLEWKISKLKVFHENHFTVLEASINMFCPPELRDGADKWLEQFRV